MNRNQDPMGKAIAEYWKTGKADRLRVFSPMFDEDEIPLSTLFRNYQSMPAIEQAAIDMAEGKTLDVGAGAGCHALELQALGIDVTAIDISPLSVETMRLRGVRKALEQDFFTLQGAEFDTVLMMMNGIGIVGSLFQMPRLFQQLDRILAPGGQLLCDSSDIKYVFETEDGTYDYPNADSYYGEVDFRMQYRDTVGATFPWLYIDPLTLAHVADSYGYMTEIVKRGKHFDFLARITKR